MPVRASDAYPTRAGIGAVGEEGMEMRDMKVLATIAVALAGLLLLVSMCFDLVAETGGPAAAANAATNAATVPPSSEALPAPASVQAAAKDAGASPPSFPSPPPFVFEPALAPDPKSEPSPWSGWAAARSSRLGAASLSSRTWTSEKESDCVAVGVQTALAYAVAGAASFHVSCLPASGVPSGWVEAVEAASGPGSGPGPGQEKAKADAVASAKAYGSFKDAWAAALDSRMAAILEQAAPPRMELKIRPVGSGPPGADAPARSAASVPEGQGSGLGVGFRLAGTSGPTMRWPRAAGFVLGLCALCVGFLGAYCVGLRRGRMQGLLARSASVASAGAAAARLRRVEGA